MGQIFDRLRNYLKSEVNHNSTDLSDNDELKKIIDELNRPTGYQEKWNNEETKEQNSAHNNQMDFAKACSILEVPLDANLETIQSSYRRLIKEYHPDKVNNLGKEIRLLAEKKTVEINQAYEYIKNIKNIK